MLGAPGCARSPKENGFDWVLMRLLAGLKVTRAELMGMGVGGLLMEIVTRPQPRAEAKPEAGRAVAALVLAAGRSTRMGGPNKLLEEINGKALVRIATEHVLASRARPVIVWSLAAIVAAEFWDAPIHLTRVEAPAVYQTLASGPGLDVTLERAATAA